MSKHKRLGAHDYHSSLLCILSTLYPPLALALTPACVLGGFLWYLALGKGVGGSGERGALGTKAQLNHSGAHSTARDKEHSFTRGNLEFIG